MKSRNDKYILSLWKKPFFIIFFVVNIFSFGLYQSSDNAFSIMFGITFSLITFLILKVYVRDKVAKYFKNNTPDKLIEFFDKQQKRTTIENKEAAFAYNKALTYCYYGYFENAIELMSEVDWNSKPPIIQSLEISIDSLICYLKQENYEEGLRLSKIALNLSNVSKAFPGSSKSREVFEMYVEIGEILTGNTKESYIFSLENKFKKLPIFPKIIIAWGIANAYEQIGEKEKADAMLKYCINQAPFCEVLHCYAKK